MKNNKVGAIEYVNTVALGSDGVVHFFEPHEFKEAQWVEVWYYLEGSKIGLAKHNIKRRLKRAGQTRAYVMYKGRRCFVSVVNGYIYHVQLEMTYKY